MTLLFSSIEARKCKGLNVGKTRLGHEVINNGQVSPEFLVSSPFYHQKTFDVGKEDTDYFYFSSDDYDVKINEVRLDSEMNSLLLTAYRIEQQHGETVVSVIYICHPLIPVKINIIAILDVEGCGKISFSWVKSCGDLTFPLYGLAVDMRQGGDWERVVEDGQ